MVKLKARVVNFKKKPCKDCGIELPPECMDLDHVRGTKEFNPTSPGTSLRKLLLELAKCEVRCPNCHRLRHYNLKIRAHANKR